MEEMGRCSATGLRYAGLALTPRPFPQPRPLPGRSLQTHSSGLRSLPPGCLRCHHWSLFGDAEGPVGRSGITGGPRSRWSAMETWRDRGTRGDSQGLWGPLGLVGDLRPVVGPPLTEPSVLCSPLQFWLTMSYLSQMTEEQTLVMYSGHPLGLFPSSPGAPRLVITNGMVGLGAAGHRACPGAAGRTGCS